MVITTDRAQYIWQGSFDQRALPEAAGFQWVTPGRWTTFRHDIAAKFEPYFDASARALAARIPESYMATSDFQPPAPAGKTYLPYQRAGIATLLQRERSLLADEMGLGKTIQVIGLINSCPDILSVLIVCPASLKKNWERELKAWLTVPMSICICSGAHTSVPRTNIIIVNYDILHKMIWPKVDLLVVDEAHYCKTPTAKRTKKTLALRADRKVFLTGTPILARPIEIYPLIRTLAPQDWPSMSSFGMRYCNGVVDQTGADFTGASNLEELHDKLRSTIMIRRLKRDVLTDLPAKTRQIIELPVSGSILKHERKVWDDVVHAKNVGNLKRANQTLFENLAVVRHETALAKVPQVAAFVTEALESSEKVVLFAHHRDVIAQLTANLGAFGPLVITGETSPLEKDANVQEFQSNPTRRVIIGNMQAMGLGYTLTAASHVIFAELDWTPAIVTQAEDRCHRIGQRDNVLAQHLVLEGSLDSIIARTLVKKQDIFDRSLDGYTDEPLDLLDIFS